MTQLLTVPENSPNPTPYEDRGWCYFETNVAAAGSRGVTCIGGALARPDLVPKKPEEFAAMLATKKFTAKADIEDVIKLYAKIWSQIAAKEDYVFFYWGDSDAEEFLSVLPELTSLKYATIWDAKMTEPMQRRIKETMAQRNIGVDFVSS